MTFIATIEPVAGCIRVFAPEDRPGKGPYIFSAPVVYSNLGKTAEVRGATKRKRPGKPDPSMQKLVAAIKAELIATGVTLVWWERKLKDGTTRMMEFKLVP